MDVQKVEIATLTPDPANVRLHDPRNLEAIKASLRRFGQQKPIVVDEHGSVVAGNGTLQAARELGWDEIDVVVTTLSGAERTAFAISDNRCAELATWNQDDLARTLEALRDDEAIDELVTGFTSDEIDRYVEGLKDPVFEPVDESEQGRLDEKAPIICPHCQREFVPS